MISTVTTEGPLKLQREVPQNWERLKICTRYLNKDKTSKLQELFLADLENINFSVSSCEDTTVTINYKRGEETDIFSEIVRYCEKQNIFLFISMLKDEKFSTKILDIITKKCNSNKEELIEGLTSYLKGIMKSETDAEEALNSQNFPGAFFKCFQFNEGRNENLNINFTQSSQTLDISSIFNYNERIKDIKKVFIYDNGFKCATVENDCGRIKYSFTSDSSCTLIVNRIFESESFTIFVDLNSGQVFNVEFKINEIMKEPRKFLTAAVNVDDVLINGKCLNKILQEYFLNEEKVQMASSCIQGECFPIKTFEELMQWKPAKIRHVTKKLQERVEESGSSKTLVCHDMKGGYLEDRFINGATAEGLSRSGIKPAESFFMVHWSIIDIFVYFSHHVVTIPPCSWISAAHRNGVKVLGTFITEWDEGSKICDSFLVNEKTVLQLCFQLVEIAVYYNFDGWLINIENKLKVCQIPLMKKFVKYLTERMHSFCPGSQVIWYDSVIKNGDLRWQNELNDLNRVFFLDCDGIFLNYNWTEKHLEQSLLAAGPRRTDVFVGIDVFGRNCVGGFSTNIVASKAMEFGLSIAIFAPGWVYECHDSKDFKENQFKFWGALQDILPTRTIKDLPYYSSFCPGFGNKMFRNGKIVHSEAWSNMCLQQPQPMHYSPMDALSEQSISIYDKDAFNGGGCICLKGQPSDKCTSFEFNILKTHFLLGKATIVSFTYKPLEEDVAILLVLDMFSHQKAYTLNLLDDQLKSDQNGSSYTSYLIPASKEEILNTGYSMKDSFHSEQTWIRRVYVLGDKFNHHIIKKVSVEMWLQDKASSTNNIAVLLGELEISPADCSSNLAYRDLVCRYEESLETFKIQCLLEWKSNPSISFFDLYVKSTSGENRYIATTTQCFYQLELSITAAHAIEIILKPQSVKYEEFPTSSVHIPVSCPEIADREVPPKRVKLLPLTRVKLIN